VACRCETRLRPSSRSDGASTTQHESTERLYGGCLGVQGVDEGGLDSTVFQVETSRVTHQLTIPDQVISILILILILQASANNVTKSHGSAGKSTSKFWEKKIFISRNFQDGLSIINYGAVKVEERFTARHQTMSRDISLKCTITKRQ
jgi:hypothetical protein